MSLRAKAPTILGQHGAHFLFPLREDSEDARDDLNYARRLVSEYIGIYLKRK